MTALDARFHLKLNTQADCSIAKIAETTMEKMVQILFNNEVEAFTGLQALQQLDQTQDISLGETYVITKDADGTTSLRSAKSKSEGTGVVGGGLIGGLIGLLAGPLGFLVGVAGGMIAGSAGETLKAEEVSDYLDQVSANIPNGKSVVIAHVWEDWETPINTAIQPLNGDIQRFDVHEQMFIPARTELEKIHEAIKEAETRYLEASGAEKADWNATLANLRTRREQLQRQLDVNADEQEKQYQLWLNNPHPSSVETSDDKRERLARRLEEQRVRLEQLKRDR